MCFLLPNLFFFIKKNFFQSKYVINFQGNMPYLWIIIILFYNIFFIYNIYSMSIFFFFGQNELYILYIFILIIHIYSQGILWRCSNIFMISDFVNNWFVQPLSLLAHNGFRLLNLKSWLGSIISPFSYIVIPYNLLLIC